MSRFPHSADRFTFRLGWRGYDRSEVDGFVERTAAELEQLRDRLARAEAALATKRRTGVGGAEPVRKTSSESRRGVDASGVGASGVEGDQRLPFVLDWAPPPPLDPRSNPRIDTLRNVRDLASSESLALDLFPSESEHSKIEPTELDASRRGSTADETEAEIVPAPAPPDSLSPMESDVLSMPAGPSAAGTAGASDGSRQLVQASLILVLVCGVGMLSWNAQSWTQPTGPAPSAVDRQRVEPTTASAGRDRLARSPAQPARTAAEIGESGDSAAQLPSIVSDVPESNELDVTLTARGDCWISARVDGDEQVERLMRADETIVFHAREDLSLKLGNAGGVSMLIGDQAARRLGADGEVVTLHITRTNYSSYLAGRAAASASGS